MLQVRETQRATGAMIKLPEDQTNQGDEVVVEIFGNFMATQVTKLTSCIGFVIQSYVFMCKGDAGCLLQGANTKSYRCVAALTCALLFLCNRPYSRRGHDGQKERLGLQIYHKFARQYVNSDVTPLFRHLQYDALIKKTRLGFKI